MTTTDSDRSEPRSTRLDDGATSHRPASAPPPASGADDADVEMRFALTPLGEAFVRGRIRKRPRFEGFGPCASVV
jgi:hypothetical protein